MHLISCAICSLVALVRSERYKTARGSRITKDHSSVYYFTNNVNKKKILTRYVTKYYVTKDSEGVPSHH